MVIFKSFLKGFGFTLLAFALAVGVGAFAAKAVMADELHPFVVESGGGAELRVRPDH